MSFFCRQRHFAFLRKHMFTARTHTIWKTMENIDRLILLFLRRKKVALPHVAAPVRRLPSRSSSSSSVHMCFICHFHSERRYVQFRELHASISRMPSRVTSQESSIWWYSYIVMLLMFCCCSVKIALLSCCQTHETGLFMNLGRHAYRACPPECDIFAFISFIF